jgi:hypothetical protein
MGEVPVGWDPPEVVVLVALAVVVVPGLPEPEP